ncbi:MAG: AarF/ABC1/UbiB kinase family protein, partial [Planctomycetes bacterium]|nr:AarF/ABC1/UbiB kinase family protein [Planctomycetota bacterium]
MGPTIPELLAALPQDESSARGAAADDRLQEIFANLAQRPVPVGSLRRLWTLGGLQAKLAMAYLAYFVRTRLKPADQRTQQLMDANLRSALRTLEAMGYLRGAVMKVGQALATFPEMLPDEFAELLGTLHFEAPPMHYSLLREHLENELGQDPEIVFASFETEACAAASLGQVHRARLPTGEAVAVKVQYPGIGRTIRADVANLRRLLFPLRLSKDWDSLNAQFGEIETVLETETDYEHEAQSLREARAAFRESDGIVIPRVHERYSTRRVLTMDFIEGDSFKAFLAKDPPQQLRDQLGERLVRAGTRLYFSRRLLYSDYNPGNVLVLEG